MPAARRHLVEAVELRATQLGEPDESGRCRPAPVPGSGFTLRADTVVEAIGQRVRPECAVLLASADPVTGRTADRRAFAGGDGGRLWRESSGRRARRSSPPRCS